MSHLHHNHRTRFRVDELSGLHLHGLQDHSSSQARLDLGAKRRVLTSVENAGECLIVSLMPL